MADESDVFVAEEEGPPRRRFYICFEGLEPLTTPPRGWRFVCVEDGMDEPVRSTWEAWFFEILRYPAAFSSGPLTWRREADQQEVDLQALQEIFDGVRAGSDDDPESLGLPGW